jgi:glycerol kinase
MYMLALDQGTTSSRAILFDRDGSIAAIAQKEFRQIFPQPGWVEHDPLEIWASQIGVAAEVLARRRISPSEIAGVGITNQRETTVVWDRETGDPIHHAIVWQDRRTADHCERLKAEGAGPLIQQKTGLVIDAYFSATKIKWILDHVGGARDRARAGKLAFGTIDAWLIWKLTGGVHATDVTNASRTMLFDINTRQWDDELLRLFDVPRSMLPEVRPSAAVYGTILERFGLGPVPIAGVAGDQQAALFGQMCRTPGMSKNTYGTGCFLLQNIGTRPIVSKRQLVTTVAWQIGDRTEYAIEGSVFIGGAVVQWLRDGLGLIRKAADIEPLAASVPDTGGVCLVPAFAGLGAPHWDPFARGVIVGITRGTTAAHLARAALESIALQSKASPCRWPTFSTRCAATPESPSASCGSTAAQPQTTC